MKTYHGVGLYGVSLGCVQAHSYEEAEQMFLSFGKEPVLIHQF